MHRQHVPLQDVQVGKDVAAVAGDLLLSGEHPAPGGAPQQPGHGRGGGDDGGRLLLRRDDGD